MADIAGVVIIAGKGIGQPIGLASKRWALLDLRQALSLPQEARLNLPSSTGGCRQITGHGIIYSVSCFIEIGHGVVASTIIRVHLCSDNHLSKIAQALNAQGTSFSAS